MYPNVCKNIIIFDIYNELNYIKNYIFKVYVIIKSL